MRYLLFCLIGALLLGCESTDIGPPGSWGSSETNTALDVGLLLNTTAVDVCDPVETGATVDISVTKVNSDLPDNTLYIEKYTVEFTPLTAGAPPIESSTVFETLTLPANDWEVLFVDDNSKARHRKNLLTYTPEDDYPSYSVKYTFYGKDKFGKDFGTRVQGTFRIAKYGDCSPRVEPGEISLVGISEPDGDVDSIIFHIRGGTGPFTVYSNSPAIDSPGALAEGFSEFSADPDKVESETTVTFTVTDAAGETGTAAVKVAPGAVFRLQPQAISLSAFSNPDDNASDDIVFHIAGGTEPYAVYSDNSTIINAPDVNDVNDVNPDGTFTIDPDSVAAETDVVLTVEDSEGRTSAATVTVTPSLIINALAVRPSSVTMAGLQNPDGTQADDISFYITGGAGPYAVYSDNSSIINTPDVNDVNADGIFTVDPDKVSVANTVTLTISDAAGSTVTATVEVTAVSTLSVSPSSVSVTGLTNPDGDTSDDITFHITGGTGPYRVLTDASSVIAAPTVNTDGTFTADPGNVASSKTVTLTVLDSTGASVTAAVTVKVP